MASVMKKLQCHKVSSTFEREGLSEALPCARKDFIRGAACAVGSLLTGTAFAEATAPEDALTVGQRETDLVKASTYYAYLADGQTRGFAALERLERGFASMLAQVETTKVGDLPAVWLVYNMGVIVKTRESLFSIDLVHRRACELAPKLDFALITHNHEDHYQKSFYRAMDGAGKTVINNFIDNYGAADWRKGGADWFASGGYTRAEKIFRIRDVEIRTSLTDHNNYLVDYTTAFEIRVGGWRMFHTGDCSNVAKLNPVWGAPDLWVVFPGCGIDIAAGVRKIRPARIAFGHLWELAHDTGRLTAPMVHAAQKAIRAEGFAATVPMWGERIA